MPNKMLGRRRFLGTSLGLLGLGCSRGSSQHQEELDAGTDARVPPDSSVESQQPRHGWDPLFDAGRSGDYFVDASVAASGDGLTVATAFKTIGEALEKASRDAESREIKVVAGIYRESVSLEGFQGRVSGLGTDKPVITGGEVLTGWEPCTSSDEPVVGPDFDSVFKVTLSQDAFASSTPSGLNLYEDGEPLRLVQDRRGDVDLFFVTYDNDFHRADDFGLDASENIVTISHAEVFSKYTQAQLENAFVYLYHYPNLVSSVPIADVDTAARAIRVGGEHAVQSATDSDMWRYSLANILPAIQKGQWGYTRDADSGSVTVYCWPNDTAHLTNRLEYSARTFCVDIPPSIAGPVTLEGLDFRQVGGDGDSRDGVCVGTRTGAIEKKQNVTIRHVRAGRTFNPLGDGYGALYLCSVDNCTVENVTVEYASGCFGIFLMGRTTDPMLRAKVRGYHARFVSDAGARFYAQFQCEFSHSLLEDNGYGAHTNQFNFYEQCDRCLVYAVKTRRCMGYVTFQEASRLFFAFCEIGASPRPGGSARALVDQQNSTPPPETDCENWVWNCSFLPNPHDLTQANSVNLGDDAYPSIRWNLLNCVVHGGGVPPAYIGSAPGVEQRREGNLYTGAAYWNQERYGWSLAESETMETDLAQVYTDAAKEDFSPAPGSPLLSCTGVDISEAVAAAKAHFPDFDFAVDLDGSPVDPEAPTVCGPRKT